MNCYCSVAKTINHDNFIFDIENQFNTQFEKYINSYTAPKSGGRPPSCFE